MHDPSKTYQDLIEENSLLKRRIQYLERSEGERKRTEQALIKSEAEISREQKFAQLLLDTSPAFIVAIGFDGKVMMMNQALLKALEYTTEEIRGTDYLTTFVPEEERGMLTGVFREIIREEKKTVNENQIRSKSGRTYFVQWYGQGVMFDGEAPNFFVGVGIDISERKKAEEALKDSEEKYRSLIENANEAIFVALDGKLVFVNPMTVTIMGYSGEELVSRSFTEFIHQDDRDMVIDRHVRRTKGEKTPNFYSFRLITKEGVIKWVELNSVLINWLGKPATLNFVNDITKRKQAEVALQESHTRLERNLKGAIDVISETIEVKGPYAPGHHQHVSALTSAIARELGLTNFQVQGIELAAAVYDIGLITIPIEFLQNSEKLDGIKLTLYQGYPQTGHDAVKKIESPWPIAEIILQHRECFDGSGFPKGIKGEAILIEARIIAVADAIEDLTSNKISRPGMRIDEALGIIENNSGTKYDPQVVTACLRLFKEKGYKMEG
ncbi:MAG: response regulator receiver [Syntrophaceae bacterium]|nr:MAG: response regulator receiver [Syntrophaceae bacterium]